MPVVHSRRIAEPCRSLAGDRQQPDGDDPTIVVAPKMLLGAKLEVPIDVPAHVVSERTGGGTVMSGLMPGAVAPDGTVASLKSGVATVLLGVSRGTGVPTKALVSVESVVLVSVDSVVLVSVGPTVLVKEAGSVMVAVGLQKLDAVIVPNESVIGSGGTTGGELIETLKAPAENDGDDIKVPLAKAPLAVAVLVAVMLVGPMIPVAGHVVIPPSDVPGNGGNMPR
jgi:hypothetical protein